MRTIFSQLREWRDLLRELDLELFNVGSTPFFLSSAIKVALSLTLLIYVARRIHRWTADHVLASTHLSLTARQTVGAMARYVVLALGLMLIVQSTGIDLTTLSVVAGALGVGVGFGLQNIISNFVSGLIIILERPIKVGDRVEIAGVEGTVDDIGTRRVTVMTNDNIAVIVPNQRFITDNVVNLMYNGPRLRVHLPLNLAPGSDPVLVTQLMLQAAGAHQAVLADPPPQVRLLNYGGPAMSFELLVWTEHYAHRRRDLISDLNFAVAGLFHANAIRGA